MAKRIDDSAPAVNRFTVMTPKVMKETLRARLESHAVDLDALVATALKAPSVAQAISDFVDQPGSTGTPAQLGKPLAEARYNGSDISQPFGTASWNREHTLVSVVCGGDDPMCQVTFRSLIGKPDRGWASGIELPPVVAKVPVAAFAELLRDAPRP